MKAIAATAARPLAAAPCRATPAPRRAAAPRPSLRSRALSDVGKYLGEAASQIFHPQADNVPWQGQAFSGKIVHHEETARLKALQQVVDSAVKEIEGSMDQAPGEGEDATTYKFDDKGNLVGEEDSVGHFVMTSIQRVFGNNFKGDESEPKDWASGGYKASGRHRSQRALRHEYERLTRFQSVVKTVVTEVEKKPLEASAKDM